jgi:hypothetical protein
MKREPGYYWVKCEDRWMIARWVLSWWWTEWDVKEWRDEDFEEINEVRILNPDEQ